MVDLPTPEGPQMTRGRMGLTGAMVDREAKIPAERDVDIGFKVSFVEKSRPMTLTAAFEPITFNSLLPGRPFFKTPVTSVANDLGSHESTKQQLFKRRTQMDTCQT